MAGRDMNKQGKESLPQGYRVFVDDNFHFMEEDERYCHGEFATYEEALASAKKIVETSVAAGAGTTAGDLLEAYTAFGDDPFIVAFGGAPPSETRFSSWDYAKSCAEKIASARLEKS